MLRPLLDIVNDSERFAALAADVAGEGRTEAHFSPAIRPYLLAALAESADALGGRPALVVTADDRSARDLARDLNAYAAPRAVRYYPSRGTGYESHDADAVLLEEERCHETDGTSADDEDLGIGMAGHRLLLPELLCRRPTPALNLRKPAAVWP